MFDEDLDFRYQLKKGSIGIGWEYVDFQMEVLAERRFHSQQVYRYDPYYDTYSVDYDYNHTEFDEEFVI